MTSCNTEFLNRMLAICTRKHTPGSRILAACNNLARFYHSKVSGPAGAAIYTGAMQRYCDCVCEDRMLTACGDRCVDTKSDAENCGACNFVVCPPFSPTLSVCLCLHLSLQAHQLS